ncbi:MAG: hypothetical protein WKF91_03175 [Segetibacter sp.]
MNYTEKDFAGCLFNPLRKDIFKAYPRLTELIKPFDEEVDDKSFADHEKRIRYIIALYDPKSPLGKDYPEWTRRKQEAALLAGFNLTKDSALLTDIFTCMDEFVLYGIHVFLRQFVKDRLWGKIVANEETFWEYQLRLMTPIAKMKKDKDEMTAIVVKTKLSDDLDTIGSRVDSYKKEFYCGDEILEQVSEQPVRLTPEKIANALKDKRR